MAFSIFVSLSNLSFISEFSLLSYISFIPTEIITVTIIKNIIVPDWTDVRTAIPITIAIRRPCTSHAVASIINQ